MASRPNFNPPLAGEIVSAPIGQLLGLRFVSAQPGSVTLSMQVDERYSNPMGTLHGGVLCDLADAAMGFAYAGSLADGESFTTLELKINFLKPVWSGLLTATGRVVKAGRTVALTECDITDEQGSLVARASSTCMRLREEMANGR